MCAHDNAAFEDGAGAQLSSEGSVTARPVLVLGMHRSGTSLVAQALAASGCFAGAPNELLQAQEDNPRGFFEHRAVVQCNERLLARCGGSWSKPVPVPSTVVAAEHEIQEIIASLTAGSDAAGKSSWFIKDPRLCLTLPAWTPALTRAVRVFVYREPLAVARSLQRRNGFPLGFGLQLWEYYTRAALTALPGSQYLAISYGQIASDPAALGRLLGALQQLGVCCDPAGAQSVFDPGLQRATPRQSAESVSPSGDQVAATLLSYEQVLLAEYCEALCAGGPLLALPPESPALLARIHDYASVLAPLANVVEVGNALRDAQKLCLERTEERDTTLSTLAGLTAEHNALAQAHNAESDAHTQTMAERDALMAQYAALSSEHDALAQVHREQVAAFDELQAEHSALEQKSNYLFHSLTEAYRGLLTFELSTLGRLQRHHARAYKWITRQVRENSRYDDVLDAARTHFSDYGITLPERALGKFSMLAAVARYVLSNPVASLRSFSWQRLKRALSIFFGSNAADVRVWVDARFPQQAAQRLSFDKAELGPELDLLALAFPACDSPQVSIVVPVYNDYRVTVHCLQSVLAHTPAVYELIIADDGSSDLTSSMEQRMQGLRIVRGANAGFLRNCNRAVAEAHGEFVLLLNNDTAVTEGWLEPLLRLFEDSSVGAVGPKLLFADGRLQEAGAIAWRDGSAWNFGRMDDAAKPAYNYVKEVDYISGACLILRRSLWQQLGGFDQRYVPAYYEDADLCFAVREAGYRVLYQPASQVFHFEGVSNGTDLNSGIKQHQVSNQTVFARKWREVLESEHYPNGEQVICARDRSAKRPCVLFIDHYVPHYDKDAGSRSTFMYVQLMLQLGYRVQFMGANFFPHAPYTETLQQMGVEVLVGESIARGLDAWLAEHAPYIDEIFLHRPHVAEQFLPHLAKLQRRPTVSFFGHDLHYLRIGREAELHDDAALRKSAISWREREYAVFEQVDRIYYFSAVETAAIAEQRPDLELRTIPLYAMPEQPLPDYAPTEPRHILFVGGYNHPPNVDAACWLVAEVLPLLCQQCPEVHIHLVGSNPSSAVQGLASAQVTVHGYISDTDLAALYRRVALAVIPLRYGAGVKGKVIEAVQHNVPVVTTGIGAEGIPEAQQVMWLADTAAEFAHAVAGVLLGDADVHSRLASYGPWLQRHFSREQAIAVLSPDLQALRA